MTLLLSIKTNFGTGDITSKKSIMKIKILSILAYWLLTIFFWSLMGLGMAGIGLSVMHDANHGAYSKKPIVNKLLGYCLNLVGGYDLNWRIQHNVLHHTYTNIKN